MAGQNFDAVIDSYRGSVPRSLVYGVISVESNFIPGVVSRATVPGGGPKHGLMQPTRAGLAAIGGTSANLDNPIDNIKIGCSILNYYLRSLRLDFPGAFDQQLDTDANAAAVLLHAYNGTYDDTVRLLRSSSTTSYRTIEGANPSDPVIGLHYVDRVLEAARRYGYTAILPAAAPTPAPAPAPAEKKGHALAWLLGAAAVGGGVALFVHHKHHKRVR